MPLKITGRKASGIKHLLNERGEAPPGTPCTQTLGWGQTGRLACRLCRIFLRNQFFIIKVGIESCSVNRYNCHLRGEIRVLVAIETDSRHHSFPCKLRQENKPFRGQSAPRAGSALSQDGSFVVVGECCLTSWVSDGVMSLPFYPISPNINISLSLISVFKTRQSWTYTKLKWLITKNQKYLNEVQL